MPSEPRWATPRTPARSTRGPELLKVMRLLGVEPMPWQEQVADVALETLPSGQPAYRDVVVTLPRQNGKSFLSLAFLVYRALMCGDHALVIYGATDENAASKKLIRDWLPIIESSPLGATIRAVNRAAGKQAIEFKNGSRIELQGRSESSVHGRTVSAGVADEAWADIDDRREQALKPAMVTRRDAQYLVVSTAGTDASLYLQRKRDAGRAAVEDARTEGVAYFEWSAPDDAPADNPETWRGCMPALGITIDEATVRGEQATMEPDEFARAFLNQWTSAASQAVIPDAAWRATTSDTAPSGRLSFGADISPSRTSAAIVVCDESGHVELGDYGMGTSWVASRLVELAKKHRASVAIDPAGPAATLIPELEAARVNVVTTNARDMAAAAAGLYDAIADQRLHVYRSIHADVLDAAIAAVRKRPLGDGFAWARSEAVADITPVVALTLALWAATAHAQPARRPRIIW